MMSPEQIKELFDDYNKLEKEVISLRKERGDFSFIQKRVRILRDELTTYKELLKKEENMVQYLLGEAFIVLSDKNFKKLNETFADKVRDLLDPIWCNLEDEQKESLKTHIPKRIAEVIYFMSKNRDFIEDSISVDETLKLAEIGKLALESGTPEEYQSVGCYKLAEAIKNFRK